MMNTRLFSGLWRLLHSNYATTERMVAYEERNSREHKELERLIVSKTDEIKDMFIMYLGNK